MVTALVADRIFTAIGDTLQKGCVLVDDDVIRSVGEDPPPSDARVIELDEATLLPGLIDAHTHVSILPSLGNQIEQFKVPADVQLAAGRANVLADLLSGVTTLRIMGAGARRRLPAARRDRSRKGGWIRPPVRWGPDRQARHPRTRDNQRRDNGRHRSTR